MSKCKECNQEYNGYWCKPCNSKHFQNDFNNWTSGNDKIDKFIQDAQLHTNLEWMPYDRFKDVKQIGKGGFGTIKHARWIDGQIREWDIENQQWERYGNREVALKKFDNFVNFNDVLNEDIHSLDIVHQDFHLLLNFKILMYISDFGLSRLIGVGANPNNPEKKNIFGVLPFIAPEVLSGEEYTKAADVYSFGIIVYEMVTGFPPYPDISHDKDLAMKICNGLRPKIPFHTPKFITRIIMRYYLEEGKNKDSEIVIQIKKAEEFSANQESTNTTTTTPLNYQTHPQAIYTSRLLNYSKLPKPKNEENFERELEELTESMSLEKKTTVG
ncbi:hypothetical protein Glove_117g79 [Diversispora epigaea]|uniref:Protein kinase domain-containing protein n=1 Tax=Diversispora epigaea TaxID=1348612 RepID=A0A397J4F8_9GLOM|nr:hypothetical protein Glove_117g79 [Diversispora epigaea]